MALPICSLRKRADRQRGQRHEDAADAKAGEDVWRGRRCSSPSAGSTGTKESWQAPSPANPIPASRRASTLPTNAPTKNNAANAPNPRGLTLKPGIEGAVTQQRLEKQRLQRDQRIKHHAEQREQNAAHGEVAVFENAQIHERMLGAEVRAR